MPGTVSSAAKPRAISVHAAPQLFGVRVHEPRPLCAGEHPAVEADQRDPRRLVSRSAKRRERLIARPRSWAMAPPVIDLDCCFRVPMPGTVKSRSQGSQPVGNLLNACGVQRRSVRYAGCWTPPPAACQTPPFETRHDRTSTERKMATPARDTQSEGGCLPLIDWGRIRKNGRSDGRRTQRQSRPRAWAIPCSTASAQPTIPCTGRCPSPKAGGTSTAPEPRRNRSRSSPTVGRLRPLR